MRVEVALAAPELARAGVGGRAERGRRPQVAVLAHVFGCLPERDVRRVRLRRAREVDRRLREVEPRLGQPDVLDRLRRRDRDEQRLRVGVADVLGGEHDHAPRDEARVLAAFEHRGEVVDRRLHVARARRLDPRRDEVVVRVAALVVDERPLARRVVDVARLERRRLRLRGLRRQLEDVQRVARVAAGAPRDQLLDLGGHLGAERRRAAPHDLDKRLVRVGLELVHLRAGEERGVHLEVRVLGRRADQRHEPFLDAGEQRVLLRLVEAVDLVEEEDRPPPARAEPLARRASTSRTFATVAETAESSSNSPPVVCATIRASVVFPEPGGP